MHFTNPNRRGQTYLLSGKSSLTAIKNQTSVFVAVRQMHIHHGSYYT